MSGGMKEITAPSNPIIKDIRLLAQKKGREREGLFIAEGLKLIIDALEQGWTIRYFVMAKEAKNQELVMGIAAKAMAAGALVIEASPKVLSAITRRDNPQNAVAVFEQKWADPSAFSVPDDRVPNDSIIADSVIVALDRVRDPGNLGTIIRTADAAGARAVVLVGDCTDPFALETVRATMGSIFAMPLMQMSHEELLAFTKAQKAQLVGTHLKGAVDYRSVNYQGAKTILLMGNEQAGMPDEMAAACDHLVRIPQMGRADSLNLAIATGVTLFEIRRHALHIETGA